MIDKKLYFNSSRIIQVSLWKALDFKSKDIHEYVFNIIIDIVYDHFLTLKNDNVIITINDNILTFVYEDITVDVIVTYSPFHNWMYSMGIFTSSSLALRKIPLNTKPLTVYISFRTMWERMDYKKITKKNIVSKMKENNNYKPFKNGKPLLKHLGWN